MARRFRVLLVGDYSVVHVRRYLRLLQLAGLDVHLLSTRRGRHDIPAGVSAYPWPREAQSLLVPLLGSARARRVADVLVNMQLRVLKRRVQPDVCHVQWIDSRAWHVARASFRRLVLTPWGTDLNSTKAPDHDPLELSHKIESIRASDLLIADSQEMVKLAEVLCGRAAPAAVVPIGIDTELFAPQSLAERDLVRGQLGIPPDAAVILSPRALRRNYGHHAILEAFAHVAPRLERRAYLLIKEYDCWDTSYLDDLRAAAVALRVAERVRFVAEMQYQLLPALYNASDLVVNFPDDDAFPVTFLESLACRTPILSKRLPAYGGTALTEFVDFIDENEGNGLCEAMLRLLTNSDAVAKRLERARDVVCERFSEFAVAAQLRRIYAGLVA